MPYRDLSFENLGFYHIFNRGVNKQNTFSTRRDYQRFIQTIIYYQFAGPKPKFSNQNRFRLKDFSSNPKITNVICFCLMPNHFHLLIQQITENGVKEFMSKLGNSYTKYFNTKHNRIGPLFQGEFKAVVIESDEQLLHVSRYIHLNPYVAELVKNPADYEYSSLLEYVQASPKICTQQTIQDFFVKGDYKQFVKDYEDYALRLRQIKHLLLEEQL